ncbi:MAG TPA: alpha/beta hydrolase [Candidatus Binatia bacterium]|nr:alpha/beta hydrolase [Candidatus Binatia bacterium]
MPIVAVMQSRMIELDGPLHFADFGGAGPTMVLVHGLGGSHVNWIGVGARLAAHARVVAPDLAGFGRTPLAGRSADVEANRRLLARFVDAVADGPVILVGNSMGGLISMLEAAERPARVSALVLVAPAQPRPAATLFDARVALTFAAYAFPGVGERFLRWRAQHLGPEELVRQTLAFCCADAGCLPADVVAAHVAIARERREMPWAEAAFLQAARSTLATLARRRRLHDVVARIAAPTLVVQGGRDRLVPLAASRATVAVRPDWTLEVFEDVGHVPQLEAPGRFADVVLGWLGSVAAAR